jgi:hypothetical protein
MAALASSHAAGKKQWKRRLCGVPSPECCGTLAKLSPGLPSGLKSRATPEEAFACHRGWLPRQDYRQVGGREFESPRDARVIVLTKRQCFGAVLRAGKEGRHMPSCSWQVRSSAKQRGAG